MKRKIVASLASVGLMTAALGLPAVASAQVQAEAAAEAAAVERCWDIPHTDWQICVTVKPK